MPWLGRFTQALCPGWHASYTTRNDKINTYCIVMTCGNAHRIAGLLSAEFSSTLTKRQECKALIISLLLIIATWVLNKQSSYRWFGTLWHSPDVTVEISWVPYTDIKLMLPELVWSPEHFWLIRKRLLGIRHVALLTIIGNTNPVPCHPSKPLHLIWRSGNNW